MPESIQAYTQRQMNKYDANRNRMIELTAIPFIMPNAEVSGRQRDFFARSATLGVVCDAYSLHQGVAREIDGNRDGHVDLFERCVGWLKTGLW